MSDTVKRRSTPPAPPEAAALASVRAALASSSSSMIVTDPRRPDNPIVLVNDAFCRLTGYAEAEILGRNCRFLQGPNTHPQAIRALREAIKAQRPGAATLVNYAKDGRPFLNCVQVLPIRDDTGELLYFVGSQLEVTPLEAIFPVSALSTFVE